MRKSFLISLAAVAVLALALASVAAADPPTISYGPLEPFSGSFCPNFDLAITPLANPLTNQEKSITFSTGAIITTGRLDAQVTNLSNGKSVVLNISGPGYASPDENTVIFGGLSIILLPPDFLYPGSPPTAFLNSGTVTFDFSGVPVIMTQTGHMTDLCAELA
jgi:hypothetical protein